MVHPGPPYTPENCPLCKMKKLTKWKLCITKCSTHPDKWMLVWGEHTSNPSKEEKELMLKILKILFPDKKFRGPRSIPEHWHYHEI